MKNQRLLLELLEATIWVSRYILLGLWRVTQFLKPIELSIFQLNSFYDYKNVSNKNGDSWLTNGKFREHQMNFNGHVHSNCNVFAMTNVTTTRCAPSACGDLHKFKTMAHIIDVNFLHQWTMAFSFEVGLRHSVMFRSAPGLLFIFFTQLLRAWT